MARKWLPNGKGGYIAADEPAKTVELSNEGRVVDSDGHVIDYQSPKEQLIDADVEAANSLYEVQEQYAEKVQQRIKDIVQENLDREKAALEKKARIAQQKLDEVGTDNRTRRINYKYEPGQLRTLEDEERQQIDIFKRNHDKALQKQHEDYLKHQHEQSRYGDAAKKLELLRLIATMTKEERKVIIDALRGLPDEVA